MGTDKIVILKGENNVTNTGSGSYVFLNTGSIPYSNIIKHDDNYSFGPINNVTQYIEYTSAINENVKTLDFWAYVPTGYTARACLALIYKPGVGYIHIDEYQGNMYVYTAINGGSCLTALPLDQWVNWSLTFDNTNIYFYKNNTLVGQFAFPGFANGFQWYFGNGNKIENADQAMSGYMDNIIMSTNLYNSFPLVASNTSTPVITTIYPNNGLPNGGEIVTITGLNFDASASVKIGIYAAVTTFINSNEITIITPSNNTGSYDLILTTTAGSITLTLGYTYILMPLDNYIIKINGQDVTQTQTQRFLQKQELNIVSQYGIASNNIGITCPFELKNILYKNSNNDRIKVYNLNTLIYTGYIIDKTKNYSKNIFEISCSPLFNILNKMEVVFSDTIYISPVQRLINLIQKYAPTDYTVINISSLDISLFPNSSIIINSAGSTANILNTIIQLMDLLNIGLFIDSNFNINLYAVPTSFNKGKNINISDILIESPLIKENKTFYYDTISIDYTPTVGGVQANYTSGTGNYIKKSSIANIYFNLATAVDISNRAQLIFSKIYSESTFKISKNYNVNIGEFFSYDNYYFVCVYKEETLQSYILKGLGIDAEGL